MLEIKEKLWESRALLTSPSSVILLICLRIFPNQATTRNQFLKVFRCLNASTSAEEELKMLLNPKGSDSTNFSSAKSHLHRQLWNPASIFLGTHIQPHAARDTAETHRLNTLCSEHPFRTPHPFREVCTDPARKDQACPGSLVKQTPRSTRTKPHFNRVSLEGPFFSQERIHREKNPNVVKPVLICKCFYLTVYCFILPSLLSPRPFITCLSVCPSFPACTATSLFTAATTIQFISMQ